MPLLLYQYMTSFRHLHQFCIPGHWSDIMRLVFSKVGYNHSYFRTPDPYLSQSVLQNKIIFIHLKKDALSMYIISIPYYEKDKILKVFC